MEQSTGFAVPDRKGEVCRLNKTLYGLKQASRAWNVKFHGFLANYGFVRSDADPCVYVRRQETLSSRSCVSGSMMALSVAHQKKSWMASSDT
jgi:hypothetical protein